MKHLFTLIALLTISLGFGQSGIKKSSLSTAGGSGNNNGIYMIYAIGEIGTAEQTVNNTGISEGFVGPDLYQMLGIEDFSQLQGVKAFPNPVQDNLHITLPEINSYEIYLFDLNGKEIMNISLEDEEQTQLQLSHLKTGMYLMTVIDNANRQATTLKIQKQ